MPAHEDDWRTRSAYSMSTASERGDVVVRVAPSPVCHAMPHPSECTAVKDVKAPVPRRRAGPRQSARTRSHSRTVDTSQWVTPFVWSHARDATHHRTEMVCMTQHSSGGTPKTARTVGVEEELLLVDSESGLARSVAHQVLRVAERRGDTQSDNGKPGGSVGPELQEQQVETDTPPERDLDDLGAELVRRNAG